MDQTISISSGEGFFGMVAQAAIDEIKEQIPLDIPLSARCEFAEKYNGPHGFNIAPMQDGHEFRMFAEYLGARRPKRIVEVGTGRGGLLFMLAGVVADGGTIVTVDLPERLGGGVEWRDPIYEAFPTKAARIKTLRGDSREQGTVDAASEILGGLADFVFIDADHSFGAVSKDYELWRKIVRPGGVIAFHDIKLTEVGQFWIRLARDCAGSMSEIVWDWNDRMPGNGIGIVEMPDGY